MHRDQRSRKGRWQEATAVLREVLVVPWQQLWGEALGLGVCWRRLQAASEGMVSCCSIPSSSRIIGFVNRVAKSCLQPHFLILLDATYPAPNCTALLSSKRANNRGTASSHDHTPQQEPKIWFPSIFTHSAEPRPLTNALPAPYGQHDQQ